MKLGAVILFVIAGLLGVGGYINASKPSYSPIVTVFGSFVLPALIAWWGVALWKKGSAKSGGSTAKARIDE